MLLNSITARFVKKILYIRINGSYKETRKIIPAYCSYSFIIIIIIIIVQNLTAPDVNAGVIIYTGKTKSIQICCFLLGMRYGCFYLFIPYQVKCFIFRLSVSEINYGEIYFT